MSNYPKQRYLSFLDDGNSNSQSAVTSNATASLRNIPADNFFQPVSISQRYLPLKGGLAFAARASRVNLIARLRSSILRPIPIYKSSTMLDSPFVVYLV